MKVLHLVTVFTPDGAFGGPTRAALNQAKALGERGHDVTVVGGSYGFDQPPARIDGVPVVLFEADYVIPRQGYAAIRAKRLPRWLSRHLREFDLVHIHLARDLVTLPAALRTRRAGVPYVAQPHGMIAPSSHLLAPIVDRLVTIPSLRGAARVFCLNDTERHDLEAVAESRLLTQHLPNGVPVSNTDRPARQRSVPEVLFLGRLHRRKRPDVFAQAAIELLRDGVVAQFCIVGPPEGAEHSVDRVLEAANLPGELRGRIHREPGVDPAFTQQRMAQASIFVLPAEREPFGMTIVEALAAGTPVVIRADGGLAEFVRNHLCGLVVDGSAAEFAAAIRSLLADPDEARAMGQRGKEAVRHELGMDRIAREIESVYVSVSGGREST